MSACLRRGLMQKKAEPRNGDRLLKALFEPLGPTFPSPEFCQFQEPITFLWSQGLTPCDFN